MKIRNIMISVATASLFFSACGGGGGGTTPPPPPSGSSDLSVKTKTTYKVLANQTAYVTVLTGDKFINTDTGSSYYEYSVKDKGTAKTASFDRKNFGILRYENSGGTDKVTIVIKDTRNNKSQESVLTFNVVNEADVQQDSVLKTGQEEGDYGVDRQFIRDANTRFNVKDEVSGLLWNDLKTNTESGRNVTYVEAKKECEESGLRLPTAEELYSTVLYKSDNFKKDMLDPIFQVRLPFSWAEGGKMMNYSLGYIAGEGVADFRCVKGDKKYVEHVMMTDIVTGDTYDLSTGLQWTQATETKAFADADSYCKNLTNDWGHTNWSLPTINQLRSIIDNGVIAGGVIGSNLNLLSSTKVVDDTGTYYLGILPTLERTDYTINPFNSDQTASITCVRTFSQADLDQVKN